MFYSQAFKIYLLLSPEVVNFSDNESQELNSTPILPKGYFGPLGTPPKGKKKNYKKV